MQKTTVSIIQNSNSAEAVRTALERLEGVDALAAQYPHIVIKPNLCGGLAGEAGSHTDIAVLETVVELFSSYGKPLYIGEADCSFNDARSMFTAFNLFDLAKKFDARIVNLSEGPCLDVDVPEPNRIQTLRISEILGEGLIVSVPVLKTHPWTGVTVSMKNMYGAVYQREKAMYHAGLEENIVDINKVIGAHLCIVDATTAVVHGGFKCALWVGSPPSRLDLIIAGYNPVAVDAVGTTILERSPASIGHISLAARQGMGPCNLGEINITGDTDALTRLS